MVPMVHSTAVTVEQALEEAALRTGIPRLIVSDQGGDVRGGIERYCRSHRHAIATCDTAHKGANLLRRLLEADERWARFVAQLSQTKAKLQQTSLACCVGPRLRPKARFMNLAAPLRGRGGACGFSTNRGQRMNRSQTVSGLCWQRSIASNWRRN